MRFSPWACKALALMALSSSFPRGNVGSSGPLLVRAQEGESAMDDFDISIEPLEQPEAPKKEEYVPPENAEKFAFEAEVNKMLDIVVNSLYQNKDVFLRELISNASDALDKIRYLLLTEPDKFKTEGSDDIELEIQIEYDSEEETLTIRDTGIGMTHDDLVKNLGTVARSGTTKFLDAVREGGVNADDAISQIGQFGVGFYSTFLVSDRVTVASKHPAESQQYVWESENGATDFVIYPDPRGNTLSRGTEITLHLKKDAIDYADEDRLMELAKHYSEFITHKLSLRKVEEMDVEDDSDDEEDLDDLDEDKEKEEEKKDEDDLEVSEDDDDDDDEDDEDGAKKKTKKVTTYSWEHLNTKVPLWTRDKDEITDDEYQHFYQSISADTGNSTTWTHFSAEGNINFNSILYLPDKVPDSYRYGNIENIDGAIKLYVRKVLISDTFPLMPKYLGFVRGVVDSDDLPLNVNRETLQESKILQVIKKKLVRKAIDLMRSLAKESEKKQKDAEDKEDEDKEKDEDEDADSDDEDEDDEGDKYLAWYEKFSNNVKLGIIEDSPNRGKLQKLLRYQTTKSDGKLVSLEDYISRMKEWQTEIYVLGGLNAEELKKSPFLEPFKEKDLEVVYMTEAVDEYLVKDLRDIDGKKLVQISGENVKFKDEDEDLIKRREKHYTKMFKPLTKWMKKLYGQKVMRVQVAKRPLGSVPAIVTSAEFGNSANMERIIQAQAVRAGADAVPAMSWKILELNPRHPLVVKLLNASPPEKEDKDAAEPAKVSSETTDAAHMLLDMALLNGGFDVSDPVAHNRRMTAVLQAQFGLDSLTLEPEADLPVEEDEPPEPDADDLDDLDDLDEDGGAGEFEAHEIDDIQDLNLGEPIDLNTLNEMKEKMGVDTDEL